MLSFVDYTGINCEIYMGTITTTMVPTTTATSTRLVASSTEIPYTTVTTEPVTIEPCFTMDTCVGHYTCDNTTSPATKVCRNGWIGSNCQDRSFIGAFDPQCPNSQSCKNGGTCFDGICCCIPGFVGTLCQTDFIECASNPCQNGGHCTEPQSDMYFCTCILGI